MATFTQSYLVPACNLPELTTRVQKLNKRARKLNCQQIGLTSRVDHVRWLIETPTMTGGTTETWQTEAAFKANARKRRNKVPMTDTGRRMEWHEVVITGEAPALQDWTFVATLAPIPTDDGKETLNLVSCVPGQPCPPEYRAVIGRCDHCGVNRYRTETFVVRHADGTHKSVGRQCLKDFLGYNADPHQLAGAATLMADLGTLCEASEHSGWLGGRQQDGWDLTYFLAWTASRIDLKGWLSKSVAYDRDCVGEATANVVVGLLNPPTPGTQAHREWQAERAAHQPTGDHKALAAAVVEWAAALPEEELNKEGSNYLQNLNTVARSGLAAFKTAGLAASLVPAYKRAHEDEVRRLEFAKRAPSTWVGAVGERIKGPYRVTCQKVIVNPGGLYGATGIHKLTDDAGNDLTWFASEGAEWMKEGETYHIAGTVKKHDEFKDRKQTVLTRVLIWTAQGAEAHLAKAAGKNPQPA